MSMNKPSGFKGSSDTCSILKDFYKTLASSVMSSKIKSEKNLSLKNPRPLYCVYFKSNAVHMGNIIWLIRMARDWAHNF